MLFWTELASIGEQNDPNTHIMLLDDLLEACVVQLGELGQVMHVGDDVAQVLLQQVKVLLV